MKCKVAITNDVTAAVTRHDAILAPPVVIEAPVHMFWPPGFANGQNKLTYSVLHSGLPLTLDKHDCGIMIPHAHIPPEPGDLLSTLNSARKVMFSASTVRANGQPIAAADMLSGMPMLCCADPMSLPTGGAVTAFQNTANVNLTEGDIAAGLADMATEMAIDLVKCAAEKAGGGKGPRAMLYGWAAKTLAKGIKNVAVGTYQAITTDGPVEIKLEAGAPIFEEYLKIQHGFERDANGDWKYRWQLHAGPDDVNVDLPFFKPPDASVESRTAGPTAGDMVVEKDGKRYTYHSDGALDPMLDPLGGAYSKDNRHGYMTSEEIDED